MFVEFGRENVPKIDEIIEITVRLKCCSREIADVESILSTNFPSKKRKTAIEHTFISYSPASQKPRPRGTGQTNINNTCNNL